LQGCTPSGVGLIGHDQIHSASFQYLGGCSGTAKACFGDARQSTIDRTRRFPKCLWSRICVSKSTA
jgi:hypothetical protein